AVLEDEPSSAVPEDEPSSAVPEDEPSSVVPEDVRGVGTRFVGVLMTQILYYRASAMIGCPGGRAVIGCPGGREGSGNKVRWCAHGLNVD
ncbi:hypothetical protein Tco_1169278, partial [Tanacetum coccineum]